MTDNADSGADTGPRWEEPFTSSGNILFFGRAGPLDLWVDPDDPSMPFLIIYGPEVSQCNWARTPGSIIQRCERESVHLTLHDECIIHQLCASHNPSNTNPSKPNGDTQ